MALKFQVQVKVLKPVAEVFDGVVNPSKLTGYFVKTASGPLVAGQTVKWTWPEPQFAEEVTEVKVKEVVPNERIVLEWKGGETYDTTIEMNFKVIDASTTMLQISESGFHEDEKGRQTSYGNCSGWTHMGMCLKAFLEYGINLRKGGAI